MNGRSDSSNRSVWPSNYAAQESNIDGNRSTRYTNRDTQNASNENTPFDQITIPRAQFWRRAGQTQHFFKETYVHDRLSEPDVIIERISDEFRFLEENNNPPPQQFGRSSNKYAKYSTNKYLIVGLAILQIVVALLLMVFASFRYFRLYNRNNNDSLMDFIKIEDYVTSNKDGTELIGIKMGTSIFLPAFSQLIGGFMGLYPLRRRPPKSLYILHIWFMSISVLFWFRPTFYAALELNLRNVQLHDAIDSVNYRLLIALFCIVAIDVFIVNTLLIIYASLHLMSSIRIQSHIIDFYILISTVIISALCLSLTIYSTIFTLTNVSTWTQSVKNMFALYGFGLRELIVCSYIFFACAFSAALTVSRRKNMRLSIVIIQSLSLLVLLSAILNEDRLIAAAHNIRTMFTQGVSQPIGAESILLVYLFCIVLAIALCVQIVLNVMCVFHSPTCDLHTLKTNGTAPPTISQLHSQF
ncbi:hypothetical protein M3Y96_00888500 [Aphelenchoides besseyi]|nr:hypothetical protein M3Y96_00888500 [Aphelenchoides besseyi]